MVKRINLKVLYCRKRFHKNNKRGKFCCFEILIVVINLSLQCYSYIIFYAILSAMLKSEKHFFLMQIIIKTNGR